MDASAIGASFVVANGDAPFMAGRLGRREIGLAMIEKGPSGFCMMQKPEGPYGDQRPRIFAFWALNSSSVSSP